MISRKKEVDWYNNFYKNEQTEFTPWYSMLLSLLVNNIKKTDRILEIGCGQSKGLRWLVTNKYIDEKNVFGIDQSEEAISFSKKHLKKANLSVQDIYELRFNVKFEMVFMMEVIEHLDRPIDALEKVQHVIKKDGYFYLSFPNYINLPWLLVRILAKLLNKPNWIVLQPLDKIYTTIDVIRMCKIAGFKYIGCKGSNYFPPILYKYETIKVSQVLNSIGLNHLSFHPILIFQKV